MNQLPEGFDPTLVRQPMTQGPASLGQVGMGPNIDNLSAPMAAPQSSSAPNSFGGMLSSFGEWLGSNASGLASIGSIYGALDNASDIRDLGYAQQQWMEDYGNQLNQNAQFQGYGVTSANGTSTVGQDGSIDLGVGPNQQMMMQGNAGYNSAMNQMGSIPGMGTGQGNVDYSGATQQAMDMSMADPSQRQSEIFGQLMAMQQPGLDAQQAQQQAREHAMGRGGVMGSQFGGTAEDAAMAKARAQASNEAALGAMKQADAERQAFGQLAANYGGLGNQATNAQAQYQGMLGNLAAQQGQLGLEGNAAAYLPMQQQMDLLKLGAANSDMAQTGQMTGLDYLSQMVLGGANANINSQQVSSELMGNLYDSILDNLGGQSTADGSSSGLGGMLSNVGEWLGGLFD